MLFRGTSRNCFVVQQQQQWQSSKRTILSAETKRNKTVPAKPFQAIPFHSIRYDPIRSIAVVAGDLCFLLSFLSLSAFFPLLSLPLSLSPSPWPSPWLANKTQSLTLTLFFPVERPFKHRAGAQKQNKTRNERT